MNRKLSEFIRVDEAIAPQDAGADGQTSSWFDMSDYRRARAIAQFEATTATTATVQIVQATSDAGAGAEVLAEEEVGTDETTAESVLIDLEVHATDMKMNDDFRYLAVHVDYGNTDGVAATLMRADARYMPV